MSQKIAVVSHSYPTRRSPARATFIKNEAHLLKENFQTELYLPSVYSLPFQSQFYRTHEPDEDQIPFHRFYYLSFPKRKFPAITRYSLAKKLLGAIYSQNPDIIHCHWLFPTGLAVPKLNERGFKTVITVHGGDWYSNLKNQALQPFIKESLEAADRIICVGKVLMDNIADEYSQVADKLNHIPHGINTDLFKPADDQSDVKGQLNWDSDKIHLLCIANLYREKGIDLLIQALNLAKSINFQLHIISAHQNEDEEAVLENLISKNNLEDSVTFHPQHTQEELVPYLQAADILISPSRKEGFGLVVAEAISTGTPVLATKSGGPEEIVTEQTGILVETENYQAIYSGLMQIVSNLDSYDPKELHNDIKKRFSRSAKLEKLSHIYYSISDKQF